MKKLHRNIITIIAFILATPLMLSAEVRPNEVVIGLDDSIQQQLLNLESIPYWKDSTRLISYEEMLVRNPKFDVTDHYSKADYDNEANYWLKFKVNIDHNSAKHWLIEIYDQKIQEIFVFLPLLDGSLKKEIMGASHPYAKRRYDHKNFVIPLTHDIDFSKPIFVKINSNKKVDLHMNFRSINRFVQYSTKEYLWFGLQYGAFIIMAVYSLLLWTSIRDFKYIAYIGHIVVVCLYSMTNDGVAFQFLWPKTPAINTFINAFLSFAVSLTVTNFIREVVDKKYLTRSYHIAINVLFGIQFLVLVLTIMGEVPSEGRLSLVITLPVLLFGLTSIYRKSTMSPYYIMGISFLLIGCIIWYMKWYGVIPHNFFTFYGFRMSVIAEMLAFSFALYDTLRLLKESEHQAQRKLLNQQRITELMHEQVIEEQKKNIELSNKVNEELEQKVKERTEELQKREMQLEELNQQLSQRAEKLGKTNYKLDVTNYNLKDEIKKVIEKRFINQVVTLTEFQDLFPDATACKRYLAKQKWSNGFKCKQCGNCSGSKTGQTFTMRCTKCGYVDSVTSNTVFHGVKFDLTKAFYLSYITLYQPGAYRNIELSEMLNMSRNTISKFKTKVKEAKENKLLIPNFTIEENNTIEIDEKKQA
ncbi:7TM diverse intracellular signaling domain-containing protein [Flammeovirga sp. EKP202]|uniref:7TM diverse intracellular signaling domain-containing protein n=1 Tax=Flammeovirga sp. EKP202 TaxID=2770592 RepID=UPI00165FD0BB|nr:7TM diverse intracellular signaling domain-containing protein [Flammeovirga sp. EKP202]MBD0400581.1 hypothetical protein [Flammeovirga sp. EKP202]